MPARSPIAEAKARFAEFVRRAEGGDTVILTRHGRPVAQLAPIDGGADSGSPVAGERRSRGWEVREAGARYGAASPSESEPVAAQSRRELLELVLEESVWPRLPADQLGAAPSKREREEILGYRTDES